MDSHEVAGIYRTSIRKVENIQLDFKRFLYPIINWNNRLIGIKGPKGVGKTTLILQHIKETFANPTEALYVSMDNLWFATHTIQDLVEYHFTHGGTHLFLDEIHRFDAWQTLLKNLYDDFPDLHIVYTGSSMLELSSAGGDLSRRLREYTLPGLSFREYLAFEGLIQVDSITLERLLQDHSAIAPAITGSVKVLPAFERYLGHGYFPFYKEDLEGFSQRLQEVVSQIIYRDMPATEEMEYGTLQKAELLLMILSAQVPYTPNMSQLYNLLQTNREQGLKILSALGRAGLLRLLHKPLKSLKQLVSPDKIFLDNPNLMNVLAPRTDIGNIRETFFLNQLVSSGNRVELPEIGDFLVNGECLFEVGGARKSFNQIKDIPDSYLAVADTETGFHKRIPLWMFGLLY